MNNIKLENEIIALIPSNTIKNAVMELKHKFLEIELVQIIIEFAPSWVEMIDLLSDLKKCEEGSKKRYHNDGSPLPGNSDSTSKEKDKSDKFIGISNTIYDNESSFAVGFVIACAGMICFAFLKDNDILGYHGVK